MQVFQEDTIQIDVGFFDEKLDGAQGAGYSGVAQGGVS